MHQKTSKSLMLKKFRSLVRYWYDLVYGSDRLFDFLFDADVGIKVFINENMLKLMRSSRCKTIPFHLVADNLIGLLETVAQGDLLANTGNDSITDRRGCCGFGGKTEPTTLFATEYR